MENKCAERDLRKAKDAIHYTIFHKSRKKKFQSISSVIFLPRKNVGCGIHFKAIKSLSICYKFLSRLIYTYSIPKILWVYISSQSVPNIAQFCPAATVTGKVFCCVSTLIPNPIGSLFPVKNAIPVLSQMNKESAMIYFPSTVQDLKTHRYMRTEELTELYLPKKKEPDTEFVYTYL